MGGRETGPLTGPYLCLPHLHFLFGHCEHMKTDSMICLSRSFLPLGPQYAQVRVAFSEAGAYYTCSFCERVSRQHQESVRRV